MRLVAGATLFILLLLFQLQVSVWSVWAQGEEFPREELVKAQVIEVIEEGEREIEGFGEEYSNPYQNVRVKFLDGSEAGQEIILEHGGLYSLNPAQKVAAGQTVILTKMDQAGVGSEYQIIDKYRLDEIYFLVAIFFVLVLALSRWKGIGSFLGMVLSVLVIVKFIVPQILAGQDPLVVSIIGSVFILITSIYLAHGFSRKTTVAVVSTSTTLLLTGLMAVGAVALTKLSGLANEDAYALQFGPMGAINFKGLLLGGMIIGFLGVLDDITTGMSATVFELKRVNPKLKFGELVGSSLNVGREHISSLVNTLVLAYAGTSLPVFLFIVMNPQNYPLWFVINSELVAEEVVRTVVGSIGLLFAVPITALLAAWVNTKKA